MPARVLRLLLVVLAGVLCLSRQHQKVLMNPRWREIGVGYAQGGDYGNYWTALFGCRPGVLPTVALDGVTYTHTEECDDPNVAAEPAPTAQPNAPALQVQ